MLDVSLIVWGLNLCMLPYDLLYDYEVEMMPYIVSTWRATQRTQRVIRHSQSATQPERNF